jgi:hypothetical protein
VGTWALSRDTLDFGDVALDEPDADDPCESVIFTAAPDQLRAQPAPDAPWMACETAARSDNRTEILITVRRDELAPGLNRGAVLLKTTSPEVPSAAIVVTARGVQRLNSAPAHVFLRGSDSQLVRVLGEDGQPVVVRSATASDGNIEIVIVNPSEIEVRNKSGQALPQLFVVTVVDDRGRTVRIPVSTF